MTARVAAAVAAVLSFAQLAAAAPSEALIEARRQVEHPAISAVTFRAMDRFFPVEHVAPSKADVLPVQLREIAPAVKLREQPVPFDEALRLTHTNALLVIQDGAIVLERYFNGAGPHDRFMSWSIAKSVTSILVGLALERGQIKSLEEPIEAYLPELEGTAYAGVSIEHLLMMRDGSSYTEQSPTPPSVLDVAKDRSMYRNERRFTDVRGLGLERVHAPGSRFNYSTLTSGVLGRLVEAATGMTLARFTEEALWKPAGMEAEAYWLLDGELPDGLALAGGGFNATLRDFARLGLMMLNGGHANGRQVVAREWVERSTRYARTEPVIGGAPRGYQYQWWTMLGTDRFEAIGIHGQFLSIDPATRSVIVKLSHWPEKGGAQYNRDTLAVLEAIRGAIETVQQR